MVIRAPEFVAHKGFEDQNPHQGLAMTRRYDTITQPRYGPKVMAPLPFATTPEQLSFARRISHPTQLKIKHSLPQQTINHSGTG
jgi:hypothetical protein